MVLGLGLGLGFGFGLGFRLWLGAPLVGHAVHELVEAADATAARAHLGQRCGAGLGRLGKGERRAAEGLRGRRLRRLRGRAGLVAPGARATVLRAEAVAAVVRAPG